MNPKQHPKPAKRKIQIMAGEYNFFTGGGTSPDLVTTKHAAFTIYYNIALENIRRIDGELKAKKSSDQQRNNFWAEYLWKAHTQSKNSEGYHVTEKDKRMIKNLKMKIGEIRNFHSHIWHDNSVLEFDRETRQFIEQKFNDAKIRLYRDYPGSVVDFEDILQKHKGRFDLFDDHNRIKPEGRVFLLSFFLMSGQMNSFLQQRSGYKRNDLPQFKMTRLLYTEYCHRDGSAHSEFSHDNRVLNSLDKDIQADILKARTAYKLVNYLVDYPDYWGSTDAMPLFDKDGEIIKNVQQLKLFIEERKLLPGLTFQLIERAITIDEPDEKIREKRLKEHHDKYRLGMIAFTYDQVPGHTFNIAFEALHRLTLLTLLPQDGEQDVLVIFTTELLALAARRQELYDILVKDVSERDGDEMDFLGTKENQYLRGGRRLTEMGIKFFENFEKGYSENADEAIELANYLREEGTKPIMRYDRKGNKKDAPDAEPIQIYQQDFIKGQRRKFRAGNRFVFYMAKYLMDFGHRDLHFGMERFDNEPNQKTGNISLLKTKVYLKSSEIPAGDDYRLTLEGDHVFIGIPKPNVTGQKNHERFYQLAIGPKAMRYLASYIINNPTDHIDKLKSFFETLTFDLEKLAAAKKFNEHDNYRLLEKPFVSSFMLPDTANAELLKEKAKSRIRYIKSQWAHALNNIAYLSRNEKNKMIMDAYRLFDWSADRADGKFLRADEYKQLSVCHYSLHSRQSKENRGKTIVFEHLYYKVFKLHQRQPPLPNAVTEILFESSSLDDLLVKVINDRVAFFDNKLELPERFFKKELTNLCRLVGISIPPTLIPPTEQINLSKRQEATFDVLPYCIHPMLVAKHFFPEHYNAGKVMIPGLNKNNEPIKKRAALEIFSNVRKNKALTRNLNTAFYDTTIPGLLYSTSSLSVKQQKLTGLLNTTQTEDIMLWWVARQYLSGNNLTQEMATLLANNPHLTVENLHNVSITLGLKPGSERKDGKPIDPLDSIIYVSLRMHQFDDMMFATEKSVLRKAAVHFLRRESTEKELWAGEFESLASQFENARLPDGSRENPLPYQLLREEIKLVHRCGQKLADYMLTFEKKLFERTLLDRFKGDQLQFQRWLTDEFKKRPGGKTDDKPHFSFNLALKMAQDEQKEVLSELENEMTEYRNMAFHDDIPLTGSFSWYTREGIAVRTLLKINENLHAKKDRAAYLPGSDLDKK